MTFHDILENMLNIIVISCILFIVLTICKISFQLTEYVSRKIERENKLKLLLNLSRGEAALIKYLFFRPTETAWLPPDWPETILLLRKNYIEEVANHRTLGRLDEDFNFYRSSNDRLYLLNDDTVNFIKAHQSEILPKWKKINYSKKFNKYQ